MSNFIDHQILRDGVSRDCIEQPMFDTVTYSREGWIDRLQFFERPMGLEGKTELEASMYLPHQLPNPQSYFISGVTLTVLENEPTPDVWDILRTGILTLTIGSRQYLSISPLSALYVMPEGLQSSAHHIEPGLGLMPRQNFGVTLYWPRPVSKKRPCAHSLRVNLNGHLFRSVA